MKKFLFIFLVLPVFCFSQQKDTLEIYTWGLHFFDQEQTCEFENATSFGFKYEIVAGCDVSSEEIESWKNHNKETERLLKKKNGKNWKEKYNSIVAKCIIDKNLSRQYYKTVNDSIYKIGDKILIPEIYFDFEGGAEVLPQSMENVQLIAEFIKSHPNFKIEIGLHTDTQGNEEYNRKLTEFRCRSLDFALKNKCGIENQKNYSLNGYGESHPLVPFRFTKIISKTESVEPYHRLNRRIELKILKVN